MNKITFYKDGVEKSLSDISLSTESKILELRNVYSVVNNKITDAKYSPVIDGETTNRDAFDFLCKKYCKYIKKQLGKNPKFLINIDTIWDDEYWNYTVLTIKPTSTDVDYLKLYLTDKECQFCSYSRPLITKLPSGRIIDDPKFNFWRAVNVKIFTVDDLLKYIRMYISGDKEGLYKEVTENDRLFYRSIKEYQLDTYDENGRIKL